MTRRSCYVALVQHCLILMRRGTCSITGCVASVAAEAHEASAIKSSHHLSLETCLPLNLASPPPLSTAVATYTYIVIETGGSYEGKR